MIKSWQVQQLGRINKYHLIEVDKLFPFTFASDIGNVHIQSGYQICPKKDVLS